MATLDNSFEQMKQAVNEDLNGANRPATNGELRELMTTDKTRKKLQTSDKKKLKEIYRQPIKVEILTEKGQSDEILTDN